MRTPGWLSWALAGVGLGALLLQGQAQFAALNAALVLALPFLFTGLAVVHMFAGLRRGPKAKLAFLVGFYVFMMLTQWLTLIVVGLGVVEEWVGLRRRIAAQSANK